MAKMIVTDNMHTLEAVQSLANCNAEIYIDVGEDIGGRWREAFQLADTVPGVFQKDPKTKLVHHEDGSEMLIGYARLSLTRLPKAIPRLVKVDGMFWKVVIDRSRKTRQQNKYDLEEQFYEPTIVDE